MDKKEKSRIRRPAFFSQCFLGVYLIYVISNYIPDLYIRQNIFEKV